MVSCAIRVLDPESSDHMGYKKGQTPVWCILRISLTEERETNTAVTKNHWKSCKDTSASSSLLDLRGPPCFRIGYERLGILVSTLHEDEQLIIIH